MTDIVLTEVAMRDGLQGAVKILPTERKLELINALVDAGCTQIEVASFVNQKLVPAMADSDDLCRRLPRRPEVLFGGLVLDQRGMQRLLAADLDWAAVVVAASDTFLDRNQRCDRAGALTRIAEIDQLRKGTKIGISAYASCCFACPYEGPTAPEAVADLCDALMQIGVDHVYLGDTTGRGTPPATRRLLDVVLKRIPARKLGCHFHDTYGQAIANLDIALGYGIRRIDSAAGGVGRCIFAKGATGNVASEDVLTLLGSYGIDTGIDLLKLARIGQALCDDVGEPNGSNTGRALLRMYQANA